MPSQNTQLMPQQMRAAQIEPTSFDEAARTVEVVFTTGSIVRRFDYWNDREYDEELVVSEDAIDMARMNAGASVLNTHASRDLANVIGVVERAWVAGKEGRATVRLSERPELAGIVADIRSGVIRHISVGYGTQRVEVVEPKARTDGGTVYLYRATRWAPHEISFVPVPADAGSGTRSQPSHGQPCEFITRAAAQPTPEETMPQVNDQGGTANQAAAIENRSAAPASAEPQATPAPQAAGPDLNARAADISELCARHGVPALASGLIRSGADVAAAQAAVLAELARNDAAAGGHRNASPRIETARDEMQTRLAGVEQAVLHRLSPAAKLDDNGRQYRGMSLLEMGRDFLEAHNVNTRGMDRLTLAGNMLTFRGNAGLHGTSDFASLFANVANKRMRGAYEESPATYALWARRAPNATDFKSMSVVQMSGAPELLKTNEAGEFTYGTMTDGASSYGVVTYGRIVAMTRQAIINDDLRAFDRLATAFGASARRLENRLVYAQLTDAANFSAPNGNLQTGAGSVLSLDSLGKMRTAMRLQKGLGGELLNLAPSHLIVPSALEQTAYSLTSANYVPATTAAINEFRPGGRTAIEPIVETLLDGVSATAWYGVANNSAVDTVEYCYLDGFEGPVIESKPGWEVDGVEYKCRLDFAAKAIDYRGLQRAAGA